MKGSNEIVKGKGALRAEEFDILRGIAMTLVIIGHFWHPKLISYGIWSFHMPLFVLISGYFFKGTNGSCEIFEKCKKIIKTYGIPYIITYLCEFGFIIIFQLIKNVTGLGKHCPALTVLRDFFFAGIYNLGNCSTILTTRGG